MNAIFFIPFGYTFATRTESCSRKLSLVLIYFIPMLWMFWLQNPDATHCPQFWLAVALSLTGLYTIYEIGYIQNDTETIKLEQKPTSRLSVEQQQFYRKYSAWKYALSILWMVVLSGLLYLLVGRTAVLYYVSGLLAILLIYQFYNRLRSHIIMLLYFFLVSLRYIVPLLIFYQNLSWALFVLSLMIFPIVKTSSFREAKPKDITTNIYFRAYILKWDIRRNAGYRAIAYFVMCLVALMLYRTGFFPLSYIWPVVYMFLYRFAIYAAFKMQARQ